MSRSQRLLDLLQLLRRHRFPVPGATLAQELGISVRTLYRDIATLQTQGAEIEGEAGVGYVLKPGFMLPPLMFSVEELEALVLGSRWVAERGDTRLAAGAQTALDKIAAVLPPELRTALDHNSLLAVPSADPVKESVDVGQIRHAIRNELKVELHYRDLQEQSSQRLIWPFALGYFDHVQVLVAWCEQRQAFRHFRTDRIQHFTPQAERYPRRRQALLKEWRAQEGIPQPGRKTQPAPPATPSD